VICYQTPIHRSKKFEPENVNKWGIHITQVSSICCVPADERATRYRGYWSQMDTPLVNIYGRFTGFFGSFYTFSQYFTDAIQRYIFSDHRPADFFEQDESYDAALRFLVLLHVIEQRLDIELFN